MPHAGLGVPQQRARGRDQRGERFGAFAVGGRRAAVRRDPPVLFPRRGGSRSGDDRLREGGPPEATVPQILVLFIHSSHLGERIAGQGVEQKGELVGGGGCKRLGGGGERMSRKKRLVRTTAISNASPFLLFLLSIFIRHPHLSKPARAPLRRGCAPGLRQCPGASLRSEQQRKRKRSSRQRRNSIGRSLLLIVGLPLSPREKLPSRSSLSSSEEGFRLVSEGERRVAGERGRAT